MIWTKEISDFFIVQFEVRGTHEELNIGRAFDDFKNVVESPGRDPSLMRGFLLTLHGMSFPCACLAIGKDGAIITIHDAFHDGQRSIIIYLLLLGLHVEDFIKHEDSLPVNHVRLDVLNDDFFA